MIQSITDTSACSCGYMYSSALVSWRYGQPACISHRRSFGWRLSTGSSSFGLPSSTLKSGQQPYGVPGGARPVWMPTGMSNSSASARYGSNQGSPGSRPWYWAPISPITFNSPLSKAARSTSGGGNALCPSSRNAPAQEAGQDDAHGWLQVQVAVLHPTTNEAVPVLASLNETIDTLQSAPLSLRNGTDSPGPRNRDDGRSAPAWVRFTRAPRSLT